MKLLLDTQILLWLDSEFHKVSPAAKAALHRPDSILYLSSVSAWEICQKVMQKKLSLPFSAQQFIRDCRTHYDIESLPFEETSAFMLDKLPGIHGDPFDRMLICQAIEHNMTFITSDRVIQQYPVKTLW